MKKHRGEQKTTITDSDIEKYAEDHTTIESDDVASLVKSTDEELEYIDMLSGRIVGQLLKILIKVSGAKRVLEVGTFTGYSAIMMAESLPEDGEVVTLEMNLRYLELARKHFKESDSAHKITLVEGNAQDTLPKLTGSFDLAYMDGDKLSYSFYFNQILSKLKSGGLIIADNVLWDGTVLNPQDHKAHAINDFNKMIAEDSRVEQVLLPVRDGVLIIRKL